MMRSDITVPAADCARHLARHLARRMARRMASL